MKSVWIGIAVVAGIVMLWFSYHSIHAPYIGNDGYQYLDAASNFVAGDCLCTRVAHFDEQVLAHHLPLPFTHFPPGYPLLIAAISRTGLSVETSAYLLAAFGFLATIWLMWDLALVLGARAWIIAAFSLLWITHTNALLLASAVAPEPAFTALFLALATLIARDQRAEGNRPQLLLAIGAVAGFSYWLRYAGLFLIPVAVAYIAWRVWQNRSTLPWAVAGVLTAFLLTAAIMVRNIIYTGSWRGGFTSGKHLPASAVFAGTAKAFFHIVVGDRLPTRLDIWFVVVAVSALILVASIIRVRRVPAPAILLLVAVYVCGVLATGLTSIAQDFERYYLPLYPLLLAIAAVACSTLAGSKLQNIAIAAFVFSVFAIQIRNFRVPPNEAPQVVAREELEQEVQAGVSARKWLQDHVGPNDVLIAVNGQAVHYVVQRPVISVLPPNVSTQGDDEAAYRSLLTQWRARYLLLFPGAPYDVVSEQEEIPFLKALAAGTSPEWLTLAAHAPHVAIYECGSCSR